MDGPYVGRSRDEHQWRPKAAREHREGLASSPKLLLLDEATANLDTNAETWVLDELHRNLPATAVVFITHRRPRVSWDLSVVGMGRVTPRLSVVIPVAVDSTWLDQAVNSIVVASSGFSIEILLVADGIALRNRWGRRVRTIDIPRAGISAALNIKSPTRVATMWCAWMRRHLPPPKVSYHRQTN